MSKFKKAPGEGIHTRRDTAEGIFARATDDVEGHSTRKSPDEGVTMRKAPGESISQKRAPDDVEGHHFQRKAPGEGVAPARRSPSEGVMQKRGETGHTTAREADDVEGHSMLVNPSIARDLARARDKEIQRRAERHGLEEEARRPLHPKR